MCRMCRAPLVRENSVMNKKSLMCPERKEQGLDITSRKIMLEREIGDRHAEAGRSH